MKIHTKKKAFRVACKRRAKDGQINNAQGQWVSRSSVPGGMGQHYYPQSSTH